MTLAHGETRRSMGYTIAVDIGGTFTDLVAVGAEKGEVIAAKEPSVPSDFVAGVMAALDRASVDEIMQFRHGTTVGTNAIIERKGARTALLTTAGFRDVLLAGRASKPDLYDSDWDPPSPLVSREWIRPVRERVDAHGQVITELVEDDVVAAAERLRREGVEAIAICFLNAFINGDHELRAKKSLNVSVWTSSSVRVTRFSPRFGSSNAPRRLSRTRISVRRCQRI